MPWIPIGVALLVLVTVMATLLFAVLLWRNGYLHGWRAARNDPPRCTRCGYDLSGQTVRCPECGVEPTLEQQWRTPTRGPVEPGRGMTENVHRTPRMPP